MDTSKPKVPPVDLADGVAVRTFLESLRAQQNGVRAVWDPQYAQLRAFFAPRNGRRDPSEVNRGDRQDQYIINETGLLCKRVLASGMLIGMSDQTREWFKTPLDDEVLMDNPEVGLYCEQCADAVRKTFLKSNFYQTLLTHYGDEALYGTSAFRIDDDDQTDIRCTNYPNGSYTAAVDNTLRVDLTIRSFMMTARQLVEQFGRDNVSSATRSYVDSNAGGVKETYIQVAHVICRGTYFSQERFDPALRAQLGGDIPWLSIWYEIGSFNEEKGLLRRSLFFENPLMCGRWDVVGENIYGESPAMDVLGSVMSLQAWEERLAQAAEKQFNPPMVAGTSVDPRKVNTLPGETIFVDEKDVSKAFAPAYAVNFKLEDGMRMVKRIEDRIREGMFVNVFQQFIDSDRREQTAEEIKAKMQEKMQILGPVVERNIEEVLAPAVMRTLAILGRKGKLPKVPAILLGRDGKMKAKIKPVFESIQAQAQKMLKFNNISQFMQFAGGEAALDQGLLDNIDIDAMTRAAFKDLGLPVELLRTEEAVQKIRADKARAAQQAQMADQAQKMAQAAQTASQTPTGGGSNLLEQVAPQFAGGQPR